MEFFFIKNEFKQRIIKRLELKIKINDWISMILALTGTLTQMLDVFNLSFLMWYRVITIRCWMT